MRLITLFFATALVACTEKETETETENTVIDADGDGVAEADDCDDSNADINPQAEEICDGLDNNCDDEIDNDASDVQSFYEDADGDGYDSGYDCDDNDASVGPESEWFADVDMDGYGDANDSMFGCEPPEGYVDNDLDCDDSDENVNPDMTEEMGDGVDSNCDGEDDS